MCFLIVKCHALDYIHLPALCVTFFHLWGMANIATMKKFLSLMVMAATLSTSWAQLPDGSVAPDFTLTDINGQSHNLYSYLDQGKTVILDFSATWCGPCWDLHQQNTLKDLYNAFGPEGTDNLMVFKLECDPGTGLNELNGIGNTQGDWITGTPYPILDGQAVYNVSNTYQVPGYPTWYTVCPSGILTASDWNGQGYNTVPQHVQIAFGDCENAITGPAATMSYSGDEFYCAENNWEASGTLINLGETDITSAVFEVNFNGNTETVTYDGPLSPNGTTAVNLGTFDAETGMLEATLVSLNGEPRYAPTSQNISNSVSTLNQIVVEIKPDPWAEEVSWEIRDENNEVVAGATCAPVPEISWDALEVVQEWSVTLPNLGCYEFRLLDSGGDGMSAGSPDGQTVFYPTAYAYSDGGPFQLTTIMAFNTAQGDDFTDSLVKGFEVTSISTTGVEEAEAFEKANLFPNPALGQTTIVYSLEQSRDVTIEITNAMGQQVRLLELGSLSAGEHRTNLDLNGFNAGMYNVVIRADQCVKILRMTKQ